MSLPDYLEVYFWDIELDELDLHRHSHFIISRILNEGNEEALKWLFNFYDRERIKDTVKASRSLSLKTARCWQNYFDLKEEELCCTGLRLAKNEQLYYPNPLLDTFTTTSEMPGLKLASLKDIAVMKLAALIHRGSAKDFIDLYILAKHNITLRQVIGDMPAKFPGKKINNYHIIKSLSYFDDAENEPLPKMFIDFDWQSLKKYFLEEQLKLMENLDDQ